MLPNFLIVGAQKCGTTWLHENLSKHPEIFMSKKKELHLFDAKNMTTEEMDAYAKHFNSVTVEKAIGESTPNYFWSSPEYKEWFGTGGNLRKLTSQPKNIFNLLGRNVKFILLLRNPVKRAISAYYHHLKIDGRIDLERDFFENSKNFGIIHMGFYGAHLAAYLEYFDISQFTIIDSEEFFLHPVSYYSQVLKNLGVSEEYIPETLRNPVHVGKKKKLDVDGNYVFSRRGSNEYNIIATPRELKILEDIYRRDLEYLSKISGFDATKWL